MKLNILSTHIVDGFTVVQFATQATNTLDYITSVAALAKNLLHVSEISEAGSVNALRAENRAELPVFFMDGDVLWGGKQARVLNTSLLLAPKTVTTVPVSCVERGRWHRVSPHLSSSPLSAPPSLRTIKSLLQARARARSRPETGQGEVWAKVAELKSAQNASSPTESLHEFYEELRPRIEKILHDLRPTPGANGVAFFHGERLLSADVFNRAEALADYLLPLARGVLLDVPPAPKAKTTPTADPQRLSELLTEKFIGVLKAAKKTFPSPGLGTESRFITRELNGFLLEYQSHWIHLAVTAQPPDYASP